MISVDMELGVPGPLFEEWHARYGNETLESLPDLSFRDYVIAERAFRSTSAYERAADYWRARLASLPPEPDLPLAMEPARIGKPCFTRLAGSLSAESFQSFSQKAARAGLSPSVVLATLYSDVPARWSADPHFCLNLTLFNRLPVHPEMNRVIGDFTTISLLEVDGSWAPDLISRAKRLQQRLVEDPAHREFSGVEVMRELANRDGLGNAARPQYRPDLRRSNRYRSPNRRRGGR
ncbi:MAG: condensation domain-containing protein [Acidobacteriota bacterium]|nr:condensation domain-containing protein [Acidobacteriota bacterium]